MPVLELPARPLRLDATQLLAPLLLVPGMMMAAAHVPVALLTFGPLALTSWALARRDCFLLDRCVVRVEGPALELRYRGRRLCGVDLRYAQRQRGPAPSGDLVLTEGEASYLAFGVDPPDSAYPAGPDGDPLPVVHWRAVRLSTADLLRLLDTVDAVTQRSPPDSESPAALLEAVGSVGMWGRRAEALLIRHLSHGAAPGGGPADQDAPFDEDRAHVEWPGGPGPGDRPDGLLLTLHELTLRRDEVGQAARRVLHGAGRARGRK